MSQPPPCAFFLRNSCTYGDSCRNAHVRPSMLSVPTSPDVPKLGSTAACPYFLRGRCRFGDQCREFHPLPNPSASVPEPSVKPACRYFSRGYCGKGNNCPFIHERGDKLDQVPLAKGLVAGDRSPLETVPPLLHTKPEDTRVRADAIDEETAFDILYPSESTHRVMYSCNVHFGDGAAVRQIVTPFESRRVLISNIPPSASDADISTALSHLSSLATLQIHRPPSMAFATATLVFEDANSAAQAVLGVDQTSIGGTTLSGRLDLCIHAAAEEGKGVLRGRKVKLTWYGRRASAFVHYRTVQSAEEHAQRLDGKAYRGYLLTASFRRPTVNAALRYRPRSTQLYTVMVRNLPLDTSNIHLQRFCQAERVALDVSKCPEDSPTYMQHTLERFGSVDMFDTLPLTKATAKMTAFAQFETADAAAVAESSLRAAPPAFLGGIPFFIERTFSVKYNIRRNLFTKIKGALDLLADLHPSMIRSYLGENLNEPVMLVLHGSEPKVLGKMKTELDRIVQGEPLVVDGQKFWDDFFERAEGQAFLASFKTNENSFVSCDCRTRTIRLFGPEPDKVRARSLILDKLAEVRARQHVFPLRKDLIRVLLRGRLRELQDSLGSERLLVDVVARTLTVDGDESCVRRVRAELYNLQSGKVVDSTKVEPDTDNTCPVCFCAVEDAVGLDCGHLYCRDCLQHYLRPSLQDAGFTSRRCLAEVALVDAKSPRSTTPCAFCIPYSLIRSLLTSAEEDILLRAAFLAHINEHPADFRYCPSPDCEMVYRPNGTGSSFQCPSCLINICPTCNVESHEGMTCAEHQDNINGGLAALARWREKNNVKPCPNCHADIEKSGGCNHMTCFFCKTHICWICLKTFSDNDIDGPGGVYSHMRRDHGGIGV
ncbi:hypothetical protein C8R43DRAFT_931586 [Mycena crocata]|nr:hypothetical protein C8R43DRAFT_931586 [Mycena crocata]